MFNPRSIRLSIGVFGVVFSSWVLAQDDPLYQQAQTECQGIAQQQTGYSPSATQPQAGGRARGAAAGAMAGAAKGRSETSQYGHVPENVAEEYTRSQMEEKAKMGAAAGAAKQRQERRQDRRAQDAYNEVFASCMAARGFPVGN